MSGKTIYASYPVFRAHPGELGDEREVAVKELEDLFASFGGRVEMRGAYSIAGFRADADFMFWLVSEDTRHLQDLLVSFRKTTVGRACEQRDQLLGVVRPAEFSPDHQPAFVKGDPPQEFLCIYPFVRTPEWYLLDPSERGQLLREHGGAGREFPDIGANTTSAFGLGDWEWVLAFEAASPDRLVDLIRRLRNTEARRYTKVEVPFYTGIRKDLAGIVSDLP